LLRFCDHVFEARFGGSLIRLRWIAAEVGLEQSEGVSAFDGVVHVLREITGEFRGVQTELRHHDADEIAVFVEEWAAGIAGLDRDADLPSTRIVADAV
jgi:hypothetical protein